MYGVQEIARLTAIIIAIPAAMCRSGKGPRPESASEIAF